MFFPIVALMDSSSHPSQCTPSSPSSAIYRSQRIGHEHISSHLEQMYPALLLYLDISFSSSEDKDVQGKDMLSKHSLRPYFSKKK